MALDSRDKRSSAINVSLPFRGMLPVADGALNPADRLQVGLSYRGIAAGAPAVVSDGYFQRRRQHWLALCSYACA